MKRAGIAYCANVDPRRFDLFVQRNQLPFPPQTGNGYTLDNAFRLRLMLDLMGDDAEGGTSYLKGLGPSVASDLVLNAMRCFPRHPLNQIEPRDWWAGLVIFEDRGADGESRTFHKWFIGEIEHLGEWLEANRERGKPAETKGRFNVVRIFLTNASRAADFVRDRAQELGLPEGDDWSEIEASE